nr:hypothetical protein [Tanacetum cinerariifolium]
MSLENASSAITYTSISSDFKWTILGIPLVNVGELPEMDLYEEVAQQGQAPPLSFAYVPDPMELDEHVPVYVSKPEHPEYHVPSDDDIKIKDQPYIDDTSPTAESPGYIALINSFAAGSPPFPLSLTNTAHDQAPLGHRTVMIRMRDEIAKEDIPPQRRFVLTALSPGCDVVESFAFATARPSRGQYDFVDTRQSAEDPAVKQMMRTHVLEARAQIDMVEDTDSSC